MNIPLQLILFSIPSALYLLVGKIRHQPWQKMFERLGLRGCKPIYFAWSLGVVVVVVGLSALALRWIPATILSDPSVSTSQYSGWTRGIGTFLLAWLQEAIYVALGEEIFFRGFLGGWLVRRLGFPIGNTIQACVFLIPHLLLLLVSLSLWPLLIVQFIAGWLLGWLRDRSGSILPGWLAHSLVNALSALSAMK
jgi:CAAX protease family protein